MSRPTASYYTTSTATRYKIEPGLRTATAEPPKKPTAIKSQSARKPSSGPSQPAYETTTIKPPRKPSVGKSQPVATITSKGQPANKHQQTKKTTTVKDQSTTDYLNVNTQQLPPYKRDLHAIRFPCDNSDFRMNKILLTWKDTGGLGDGECVEIKKWLGCFPDMRSCYDRDPITLGFKPHPDTFKTEGCKDTFSFEYRCLIGRPAEDTDDKTEYFLYCCYEKKAGLPQNTHLTRLSGVHMYGDAFLFKMEGFDRGHRPNFLDMPPKIDESTLKALLTFKI